jgi:HemY protein
MKRVFLACLLALVAAVFLVAAIETDPGYMLLTYNGYSIETSVWIALALIIVLWLVIGLALSLCKKLLRQGGVARRWLSGKGLQRSQQQTTAGLIAYTEGNWARSRRLLLRAADKSETPLLNYLVAAKASNALGEEEKTKQLLKNAEQSTQGSEVAVGLTQAELQIQNGKLEQALATLMRIRRNANKHPQILSLLKTVYVGLGDWDSLLELLPQLKKHQRVDERELAALQQQACTQLIINAAAVKKDPAQQLQNSWLDLPKVARSNSELVAVYAEQLMKVGAEGAAAKVLSNQLSRHWHSDLVDLYGQVQAEDVSKQLLMAENWLKERNNDARLLLCLGRLSLRNELWGKAREYFESSLKLEENPQTCAELGRLLGHLGEHEKSNDYFHQGLLASTAGLRELPMPHRYQ